MKFIIVILFSSLILAIRCTDNIVDSDPHSVFYPLAVGNSWIYNFESYDSLGNVILETQLEEKILSTVLSGHSIIYEFDSPTHFVHNDNRFLQSKTDGLHILLGTISSDIIYIDYLLFKYPCEVNEIYTNGEFNQDTTFVISLDENVICEAGTFSCIVYKKLIKDELGFTFGYEHFYISYGIGKIKSEVYLINQNQQFFKGFEYSLKSNIIY